MSNVRRLVILLLVLIAGLAFGCTGDVKIGAVISRSGAVESYGARVTKGLDLAVEELNAAGGYKGGNVQLIYRDDATNAAMGRKVTEELIKEEGVRVIIGAIASPVTLAIAPMCEQTRTILFSPTSSAPTITDAGDYIFRNYPSDILEGTAMARFARDLGLERVVVFAVANEFGAGLRDVFSQQYAGRFRQVVKTFDVEEGAENDFAAMAKEAQSLNPDGIYIVSYVNELSALLRALKETGVRTVLMGSSAVTDELVKQAEDAAESLVYPHSSFDLESTEPAVAQFVSAYRAKYNEDPDIYAAHGYDALKLLVEAMHVGHSPHPNDIQLGLRGIKDYKGAAGPTVFDANGDVVRYPRIFIIRNGKSTPYEKFVDEGGSLFSGS